MNYPQRIVCLAAEVPEIIDQLVLEGARQFAALIHARPVERAIR